MRPGQYIQEEANGLAKCMREFDPAVGDQVRIDIPDETDPDHDVYHEQHGVIVERLTDDAGRETGDERDRNIFRVKLEDESRADFRWRDLRPPIDD